MPRRVGKEGGLPLSLWKKKMSSGALHNPKFSVYNVYKCWEKYNPVKKDPWYDTW